MTTSTFVATDSHTPLSPSSPPSEEALAHARVRLAEVQTAVESVIFGQSSLIESMIIALLAQGHVLLEGLPGLGKTELVKTLAKTLELDMRRVQFTPDLLPGDITGNPILQNTNAGSKFVFHPGPIFTNILLADEINRASPKTQSALLEAMQEKTVTVVGDTHLLPRPFFVLATQNPIDLEGTYPLPEAQLDRFLFKLEVHSASREVLERIVRERHIGQESTLSPILSKVELTDLIALARQVFVPQAVANYIARIVEGTTPQTSKASQGVRYGASPRAALGLGAAGRARAVLNGRANVSFDDIEYVAVPVLRHRIILDYSAKLKGRSTIDVIRELLTETPRIDHTLPKTLRQKSPTDTVDTAPTSPVISERAS